MSKRIKELLNALAASTQRVMKAIEIHTHPDLAKANHKHDDLIDKMTVYELLNNFILGKRQTIKLSPTDDSGVSNFLLANMETAIDPDSPPPPDIIYHHLFHFNDVPDLGFNHLPDNNSVSRLALAAIGTSNYLDTTGVSDGVSTTRQVTFNNRDCGLVTIPWENSSDNDIPLYSDKSYWSESFVWRTGKNTIENDSNVRRILRCIPTANKPSQLDKGLALELLTNGKLRLTLQRKYQTWTSIGLDNVQLYVNKADLTSTDFPDVKGLDDGLKHSIEVVYRNGQYSIWIDGVSKQLRDNSNNVISTSYPDLIETGQTVHQYSFGNVWVSEIPLNQPTDTICRMFGGVDGGGCKGYIDEYAFKEVSAAYRPGNAIDSPIITVSVDDGNENDASSSPPPEYIGTSKDIIGDLSNGPLVVSMANGLKDRVETIERSFSFSNLPINNRVYVALVKDNNSNITILTSIMPPIYETGFKNQLISQLFATRIIDDEGIKDTLRDNYGNNWLYDTNKVELIHTPDVNNFDNIEKVLIQLLATDSYLTSNLMALPERWQIQFAFRRNSANYGVLFQTADDNGLSKPGIKVEYLNTPSKRLRFTISVDGINEVYQDISDSVVTNILDLLDELILIEFFYTGYKYGFRIGSGTYGSHYSDSWVDFSLLATPQNHDRTDIYYLSDSVTGLPKEPVKVADNSKLTIGGKDSVTGLPNAPVNLEIVAFNLLPYLNLSNDTFPDILQLSVLNQYIHYFNKSTMKYLFISAPSERLGSPPQFQESDNNTTIIYLGHADIDQGGVREITPYALNGRYETEWLSISMDSEKLIKHAIGDSDLTIEVYLNKVPIDKGMWKDAGIYFNGADSFGIGISSVDASYLKIKTGSVSIANLGSSPFATNIEDGFMKVVVTRNW